MRKESVNKHVKPMHQSPHKVMSETQFRQQGQKPANTKDLSIWAAIRNGAKELVSSSSQPYPAYLRNPQPAGYPNQHVQPAGYPNQHVQPAGYPNQHVQPAGDPNNINITPNNAAESTTSHTSSGRIEQIRYGYKVPALAAAVVKAEATTVQVAGVRKLGSPTLITESDKFHLGSCTKAMTATLLAVFIERGAVNWSTTLQDVFPEWINIHAQYKTVTLEMLTTHRAGIHDEKLRAARPDVAKMSSDRRLDPRECRRRFLPEYLSVAPPWPPGTVFHYSNISYITVGAVLEKISGKPWEQLMREMLFGPLDMRSAGFGAQAVADEAPTFGFFRASSHARNPTQPWGHDAQGTPTCGDNSPFFGPAGTVHCSLADWGKFALAHLDGYNGKDTVILKAESFKKLHTSPFGHEYTYGGWFKIFRPWAAGYTLSHEGSNTYNQAIIWIAPTRKVAYLAAGNSAHRAPVDDAIDYLIAPNTSCSVM